MAYIDSSGRRPRFNLGDALQATLDAVGTNFGPMVALSLVLVGIPYFIFSFANFFLLTQRSEPAGAGGLAAISLLASMLVYLVTQALLQAAVVRMVVVYLNGGKPRIGECLSATVRLILPILGIAILTFLCLMVGFIVLIVPGIFLWVALCLAAPAEVIEQKGVFASLGRSFQLSEGKRWMILGVLLILFVLNLIIGFIGGGAATLLFMIGGAAGFTDATAVLVVRGLVNAVATSVAAVFFASAIATLYTGIRRVKEGATPQSLAAVFD